MASDGRQWCESANGGFSYLIPSGWYASWYPTDAEAATFGDNVNVPNTALACAILTIAPNESRFEVSSQPGLFFPTEFAYDAYDLAVFSTGLAGDIANNLDAEIAEYLAPYLKSPPSVSVTKVDNAPADDPAAAYVITVEPAGIVEAEARTNLRGTTGVRLSFVADVGTALGGGVPVGEQLVVVFVERPDRSPLRIVRLASAYPSGTIDFEVTIDTLFEGLVLIG